MQDTFERVFLCYTTSITVPSCDANSRSTILIGAKSFPLHAREKEVTNLLYYFPSLLLFLQTKWRNRWECVVRTAATLSHRCQQQQQHWGKQAQHLPPFNQLHLLLLTCDSFMEEHKLRGDNMKRKFSRVSFMLLFKKDKYKNKTIKILMKIFMKVCYLRRFLKHSCKTTD